MINFRQGPSWATPLSWCVRGKRYLTGGQELKFIQPHYLSGVTNQSLYLIFKPAGWLTMFRVQKTGRVHSSQGQTRWPPAGDNLSFSLFFKTSFKILIKLQQKLFSVEKGRGEGGVVTAYCILKRAFWAETGQECKEKICWERKKFVVGKRSRHLKKKARTRQFHFRRRMLFPKHFLDSFFSIWPPFKR